MRADITCKFSLFITATSLAATYETRAATYETLAKNTVINEKPAATASSK